MRETRTGTGAFIAFAASSMLGLILAGFAAKNTNRGLLLASTAFTSVALTFVVLLIVAYRRRRRLYRIVESGGAEWAADCLILQGDSAIPGNHQDIMPPGPKGTLTLTGATLSWTPDTPTRNKGYENFTINIFEVEKKYEKRARDITGISVDTWAFLIDGTRLRRQIALQTSELGNHLP